MSCDCSNLNITEIDSWLSVPYCTFIDLSSNSITTLPQGGSSGSLWELTTNQADAVQLDLSCTYTSVRKQLARGPTQPSLFRPFFLRRC